MEKQLKNYVLGNGIMRFNFLKTGNLYEITDDSPYVRINTYCGNNLEATISNIYLLVKDGTNSFYTRLLGVSSPSSFSVQDNKAIYKGSFQGVDYQIVFKIYDDIFIYSIDLKKTTKRVKVKLFYGIDLSISDKGGIDSNEAYISQYIDHKVFKNDTSYIICSRQNQGRHNYFELGSLNKTIGYSTDGFQFFGKEYKKDYIPRAIKNEKLDSAIYQYEFAYPALETEEVLLDKDINIKFYGGFSKEHNIDTKDYQFFDKALALSKDIDFLEEYLVEKAKEEISLSFDNIYPYYPLNNKELGKFYPERYFEEKDQKLYSFFLKNKAHVVISIKENVMERPSGDIILSLKENKGLFDLEHNLASTTYIYGVFNSQIVYGNTSFNKLLSNQRNPLNLQKITGERIFVKVNNEYQLLAMPASYEMGLNYAKWIYKVEDDYLIIKSEMALDESKVTLTLESLKGITYDILVTHHITLKQTENDEEIKCLIGKDQIRFDFSMDSMTHQRYPEYYFILKSKFKESYFIQNNLLVSHYQTNSLDLTIEGLDKEKEVVKIDDNNSLKYLEFFDDFLNHLEIEAIDSKIDSYNYLIYWFLHDALIHYISPHGLEQYNGAAWGTRDVCQGPLELFLSLGKYEEIKRIIKVVFSHQFMDTYTFPQWFMFDRFTNICDTSSHGDVIIWPLRMVGMYLKSTNDYSILNMEAPYLDRTIMDFNGSDTILNHIKKAISNIQTNFIKNTYLSSYGGGDWDDTLQPAKKEYKEKMVSGWTPELTYEAFMLLSEVLESVDSQYSIFLKELSLNIQKDFRKYMIKDGVPVGFALFDEDKISYIIHPTDNVTNLHYRLLPLTRAGISQIVEKDEALSYLKIIEENLLHPDGVRLMDRPIKYHGGINFYFQRAETSANFGREIGMQYCHAHIRYCEFLQKLDLKEKFNQEFLKINPIIILDVVKNAERRQRNSYFSSSDADFLNRYLVQEHFDFIKEGKVKVKGGWRVYSSGSGIYLYNFITGLLGINIINNKLVLKPHTVSDLKVKYRLFNKDMTMIYQNNEVSIIEESKN